MAEEHTKPPPPSIAERRKARRKALIQEHIRAAEHAAAGRQNKQERDALVEVVAGLRRREEELDRAEDAEAWAAAHPPKLMPEETVADYLAVHARASDELDALHHVDDLDALDADDDLDALHALHLTKDLIDGMRKNLIQGKERAEGLIREYRANGYIELFDADDFGLPPNYTSLLRGMSTGKIKAL